LRYAIGCDITSYFLGELDIEGLRHKHGPKAIGASKALVKWRLQMDEDTSTPKKHREENNSKFDQMSVQGISTGKVFRIAKIVGQDVMSVNETNGKKCIRLRISVKRDENTDKVLGTPLPTSTFIFRVIDSQGNTLERPYNTSNCYIHIQNESTGNTTLPLRWTAKSRADEVVYEFFISLLPGGKMSSVLANKLLGKNIMVNGPMASEVSWKKSSPMYLGSVIMTKIPIFLGFSPLEVFFEKGI